MVAVTVAPGIGVLPDLTNPEIENEGGAAASCAIALAATSKSSASLRITPMPLKVDDVRTLVSNVAQSFIRTRTQSHKLHRLMEA